MGTDLPTERQGQLSFYTMKDSMVFYRSFYEALKDLPDNDRLAIYDAIFSYGLDLKEVELSGIAAVIWKLVKPNIEANNRRYENGKKGAKAKQEESKRKAKGKQRQSKPKANVDEELNNTIYHQFNHLSISVDENQKLIDKYFYTQSEIDAVYQRIENYRQNKKYSSLYLTALDWLKRDFGARTAPLENKPKKSIDELIAEARGF